MKKSIPRGGIRSDKLLVTVVLLVGTATPLQAGELAYGLGYLATHSDNISRVPTNERSEWIHSLLAGFAYQENTTDLVARVLAQAEYNNYQKGTYGNETLYYLNSSAVWTISPQRFFWTVEDTARQALVDSTAADTPSNRAEVNVLSTGPDFFVRFSPVQALALGARLGDVYTGRANADSKRFNGMAGWQYQASSVSTYSLNYQAIEIRHDNFTLNNDFRRQDVFARAQYRPSRSQYTLDLGKSDINRDRGSDLSGTLARLMWTRQLTTESILGISASREFSDTSTDILTMSQALNTPTATVGQTAQDTALTSGVLTSDVYLAKHGEIFSNLRGSQLGVQLHASQRKYDFETIAQDRKENDGRMEIDYFYSAASTVSLFTRYTKIEYLNFIRSDTDYDIGIRYSYRLTRTVSWGLEGLHNQRRSTDPTQRYVDNRVLFSILYSSGPLFMPVYRR